MSSHQEYKCSKCGCEWEALESPNCPQCMPLTASPLLAALVEFQQWLDLEEFSASEQRNRQAEAAIGRVSYEFGELLKKHYVDKSNLAVER